MRGLSSIGRKYGYRPDLPDFRDHLFAFHGNPANLPVAASLEKHEAPIFDQGHLGSCTGNGISMALKIWMNANNYKWPFTPSRLQIYYDERALEGNEDKDAGAYIRDGFKVVNGVGAAPEDSNAEWSWPYSSNDERWKTKPPEIVYKDAALHKCLVYERLHNDENSIKAAIAAGFPLVIGIGVYQSFESAEVAKTGDVPMPKWYEQLLGGHCLTADAYDEKGLGGPNSWGAGWGREGHYHLPWEYVLNKRLTSDIWRVGTIS